MVELSVRSGVLLVTVRGFSKVWALKSRIEVPVRSIRSVRHDPDTARQRWKGLRFPGTHVPFLITAGTFYRKGERVFWDVVDAERAVVVELEDHRYDRLVVQVDDPKSAVRLIRSHASRT